MQRARETGSLMPPKIILNAPTRLMKQQEYGAGYRYDHDAAGRLFRSELFPRRRSAARRYYDPPERGFEREIRKRLDYWAKLRDGRQ